MLNFFLMQQRASGLQQLNDRLVGFENLQAIVFWQTIVDFPCGIHIASNIEFVTLPCGKIFRTMRRRRVDDSGSGIHGYVIRNYS